MRWVGKKLSLARLNSPLGNRSIDLRFWPLIRRSSCRRSRVGVNREVAGLCPYCGNLFVASLEQVEVPASHTR